MPVVDVGEYLVLPGLVETHAHINEPGRTHWEGFASATRAAAASGITTLIDMPLNSDPVTTNAGPPAQATGRRRKTWVDCGFTPASSRQRGRRAAPPGCRSLCVQGIPLPFRHRRLCERLCRRFAKGHADPRESTRPVARSLRARRASAGGNDQFIPAKPKELRSIPGDAASGVGSRRDSIADRTLPRIWLSRAHRSFGSRSGKSPAAASGEKGRFARHSGNLPALSLLRRRVDPRRRHTFQVCSAYSRSPTA